jgi:hypothetical protein
MNTEKKYAVCVRNEGHEESLELRKIYEILPDPQGDARGFVRVVDEDEDYLYPASWFMPIQLPVEIEEALTANG